MASGPAVGMALSEFSVGHVGHFRSFLTGHRGEVEGIFDVVLTADHNALVGAETCTCGDEVTADDVLLHALEIVDLAVDGSFVEDLGGLLEGCSRHERRCLEGGAGDTLENLLGGSGLSVADNDGTEVSALER